MRTYDPKLAALDERAGTALADGRARVQRERGNWPSAMRQQGDQRMFRFTVTAVAVALVAGALLTSPMPSFAQGLFSGTPQERSACRRDVRKFCRHIKAGAGSMTFLHCLQEHRTKLSRACGRSPKIPRGLGDSSFIALVPLCLTLRPLYPADFSFSAPAGSCRPARPTASPTAQWRRAWLSRPDPSPTSSWA